MPEPRPDAMTELVRILREQLDHKDERIATLEKLLEDANRRIDEQQRLMVRLLERSFDRSWAQSDGLAAQATPPLIAAAETTEEAAIKPDAVAEEPMLEVARDKETAEPLSQRIELPRMEPAQVERPLDGTGKEQPVAVLNKAELHLASMGPQIEVIAEAVVAAARRPVAVDEVAEDAPIVSEVVMEPESEREALAGSLQAYVEAKDEVETTLRLDRNKLRKGHRQMDRAKRGFLPWRRNREG